MAYILYINGHKIECNSNAISQTRQVNDLAKLDNRQSSVTNKFTAPFTPRNVKAMEHVYLTGSQSNVPYQKNVASLYDADSGACLIYNGWANITQSSKKGYDISITDGLIDFYRRIENKTLTDIGISDLNHSKNLTNIVDSWQNNKPYIYAIADYNGNNQYVNPAGTTIQINTDFQVPSARMSYLWNQIHLYAGFTFSGSYFQTQDFLNWFMSFPKPVPTLVPLVELVTSQQSSIDCQFIQQPDFSYIYLCNANLFPIPLGTLPSGSYRIKVEGLLYTSYNGSPSTPAPMINYYISGNNGVLNSELGESVIVSYNAGDFFWVQAPFYASSGSVVTTIERVLGYDANFEEAFVDFTVTDIIKEVVTHGGLTAFKDKHSNHIEYLTMSEILQSNNIEDWSDMFQYKDLEKYRIGNYAKRNNMKYRYNTENETHSDGYIEIADENLLDETDVVQSKVYSPERDTVTLIGNTTNVFKIWEKELQDDSTIEYKDLSGRFYFLRFELKSTSTVIGSKTLNQHLNVTQVAMASYSNMKWQNIINSNYPAIKSILDKAKVIDGYFYLKPTDVERYSFKGLIYVEQLASYYLVNKIMNFVKGKVTKCELLEVDYKKVNQIIGPTPNTATYITIDNIVVVGCVVTVTYSTDATLNSNINLICDVNGFGMPIFTPSDPIYGFSSVIQNTAVQNTVSFTLQAGTFYVLRLNIPNTTIGTMYSNQVAFENSATCLIVSPTSLVITNVTLLSQDGLTQTFQIDFTTDAVLPRNVYVQNYKTPVPSGTFGLTWGGWSGYSDNGTANTTTIVHGVSRIFGDPLQLQIKIGAKESNIFTI